MKLSYGMTRVTMPSRDSPGSVDPDDVEVAEVNTLFVSQGRAGAALGAAGCTGSGLLCSAVLPRAELGAQDRWGEKEQVSGVPSEARGALHPRTDARSRRADQSRRSLRSAFGQKYRGKGLLYFCLLNMTSPLPLCLINLQRDYTSAEETTTCKGTHQPL